MIGKGTLRRRHSIGCMNGNSHSNKTYGEEKDNPTITHKDIQTSSFFECTEPRQQKFLTVPIMEQLKSEYGITKGLTKNISTGNMDEYLRIYNKTVVTKEFLTTILGNTRVINKEEKVAGKVTDNVNWKHVLIGNFNYLRDNIDPMYLRNKLYDEDFLPRNSVKIRKSERRYIKSTLVMIAVAKKIHDKSSFIKFKDILRKYQHECCAVILEKQPYAVPLHVLKTEDIACHVKMLTEAKIAMEEGFQKLSKEKLLNLAGTFLEKRIFDLIDIDDIIHCIFTDDDRRMASVFIDKIIEHTGKGSYRCLVNLLQQYTKRNEIKQICQKLQPHTHQAQVQVRHVTPTPRMELTENSMLRNVTGTLPRTLCKEYDLQVTNVMKGSIIIYLKSMKRGHLNKIDMIERLFNDRVILESFKPFVDDTELKSLCPGIAIVLNRDENSAKSEETDDQNYLPLSIIEANRSFLIEEIDTGILLDAFKRKGINTFEGKEFDLKVDRRTKAKRFLEMVDTADKTEMMMMILEEEEMEEMSYIAERLRTYQRIYKTNVDSSILVRCILLKFEVLVSLLEIDDIEDVFLERKLFSPKIFDDIRDTFGEVSVAAILIQIVNFGKNAMLSLIDVLFLKGKSNLAQSFLDSASADIVSKRVNCNTTEENDDDNLPYTEFSITIELLDIKGMQENSTDCIMVENQLLPINKEVSYDEQKYTEDTSGAEDEDSLESGYDSSNVRSRCVSTNETLEVDLNNDSECSVQSSFGEDLNQSVVVIDLKRNMWVYDGKKLTKSNCGFLNRQQAFKSSDGVTDWYEVKDTWKTGKTVPLFN